MRKTVDGDLAVACPLCHAQPGYGCVSTGGHGEFFGMVHRERRRAAQEARDD